MRAHSEDLLPPPPHLPQVPDAPDTQEYVVPPWIVGALRKWQQRAKKARSLTPLQKLQREATRTLDVRLQDRRLREEYVRQVLEKLCPLKVG